MPVKASDFVPMEIIVGQLYLDLKNYRFLDSEECEEISSGEITDLAQQSKLMEMTLKMKDTYDLLNSIRETKGPIDRPIVVKIDEDKYKVLEGNRRVACVKKIIEYILRGREKGDISKDDLMDLKQFENVPVLLLKEDANTPENQREILGIRHTVGIKSWDPSQKAKIIKEFKDEEKKESAEIGKLIGMTPHTVNRLYRAYGAFQQFCEETDSTGARKFSYFMETAGKPNVREFLGMDPNTGICKNDERYDFYDWIIPKDDAPPKIPEAEKIREFSKILESSDAYEAFVGGASIDEAYSMARGPRPEEWMPKVRVAINALDVPHSELRSIGDNTGKQRLILELINKLQKVLGDAKKLVGRKKRKK